MYMSRGERMETSAISGLAITTEWGDVSRRSRVPSFRTTMTGWPCGGMISKAKALTARRQRANAAASPNTRRLIDKRLLHFSASRSSAAEKWSSRLSISRRVLGLAAAFALCLLAVSALAFDIIPPQGQPVIVVLNEGTLLRLDTSPHSVVIANPDIADVSIRSPRLMYIFGKHTGETTLYATDNQEHILFNITV